MVCEIGFPVEINQFMPVPENFPCLNDWFSLVSQFIFSKKSKPVFVGLQRFLDQIGSDYKIYRPKVVVFRQYYILFFDVVAILNFSLIFHIYVDNPRLIDFIVENTLSFQYSSNSSAQKIKCFNHICKFVY